MALALEQRRAARITVDLPVRFRCIACSLDGRACDLSPSGLCFLASLHHGPHYDDCDNGGTAGEIVVEIDLPDTGEIVTPLTVVGQVCWETNWLGDDGSECCGMGIRFTNLSVAERRRLANFVILRAQRR